MQFLNEGPAGLLKSMLYLHDQQCGLQVRQQISLKVRQQTMTVLIDEMSFHFDGGYIPFSRRNADVEVNRVNGSTQG